MKPGPYFPSVHGSLDARVIHAATWVLATILLMLPNLARASEWPHTRKGWTVGLGLGGGTAGISADGESSDRKGGAAASFRAGYVFTPELQVGLESNAWTKDEDGTTLTFSVVSAALTYFPSASAFFVRGGVGAGTAEAEFKIGDTTVTGSEDGFGVIAAAGYEWRVSRTIAISPELNFGYGSLSEFSFNYFNGGVAVNWYFIPK